MTVEELLSLCDRVLSEGYSVRVAHVNVRRSAGPRPGVRAVIPGWQWQVSVTLADGSIVDTDHNSLSSAVRLAHAELTQWVRLFGTVNE